MYDLTTFNCYKKSWKNEIPAKQSNMSSQNNKPDIFAYVSCDQSEKNELSSSNHIQN